MLNQFDREWLKGFLVGNLCGGLIVFTFLLYSAMAGAR